MGTQVQIVHGAPDPQKERVLRMQARRIKKYLESAPVGALPPAHPVWFAPSLDDAVLYAKPRTVIVTLEVLESANQYANDLRAVRFVQLTNQSPKRKRLGCTYLVHWEDLMYPEDYQRHILGL